MEQIVFQGPQAMSGDMAVTLAFSQEVIFLSPRPGKGNTFQASS
jgi:hypothetical protein